MVCHYTTTSNVYINCLNFYLKFDAHAKKKISLKPLEFQLNLNLKTNNIFSHEMSWLYG
jgi:hypothetical protein